MAIFEIKEILVGPEVLTYKVHIAEGHPLTTAEDFESVNRVVQLMPEIGAHVCVSEAGDTFKDALPNTEVAHLLEHVVVELVARTGIGDIVTGQTRRAEENRTWETRITCDDDTLTIAALSSAVWMLEWAYSGGGEPMPNTDAIAQGLVALIKKIDRV